MAVVQKQTRSNINEQGSEEIVLRIDVAAGADGSTAFTFARAFAAKPIIKSIVRDDDTGIDVACVPSITSLTAAGGTLRHKGTSTVIMTYNVVVQGNYNNPTAYLRS